MSKGEKGNRGLKTGSIFKEVVHDERGRVERTFYVVRKRYVDADGRLREKKRIAGTYADALDLKREIEREIAGELAAPKQPAPEHTFRELADAYERDYVRPASYVGDEKVSGLREPLRNLKRQLRLLRDFFGDTPLAAITYEDCRRLKDERLAAPVVIKKWVVEETRELTKKGKKKKIRKLVEFSRPRGVASVNHDLKRLRRLLNMAVRRGWIAANPMAQGDPLISEAAEGARSRILTAAEEAALVEACSGPREHLLLRVLLALDTAARPGELQRLAWRDIDFDNGVIPLVSYKGKKRRERLAPMTSRLRGALLGEFARRAPGPDDPVLTEKCVKRSFSTALRLAGIEDFRPYDLRHVATTHMVETGMADARVMKITGHTQHKTFLRYVNDNLETARAAAELLDERRERLKKDGGGERVN